VKRLVFLILLAGCPSADDGGATAEEGSTSGTGGATTGGGPGTSPSTSGADSSGEASTVDDPSTGSGSTDSSGSSTTAAPEQACGLEDLKPGEPDPIDAGTDAMQIPPDIRDILLRSCGCHLADDLVVMVADYPSTGAFDMTTWAGWHVERMIDNAPYQQVANAYLEDEFMPLASVCNVDGEATDPADRAVLIDWTSQSAPDGATWSP
jgi:hypothetical protein